MQNWKKGIDYPEWLTEEGLQTLSKGYVLEGETPFQMYHRVARAAAKVLNKPELESIFYNLIVTNKLCLATPVATNLGTDRGLPISCNSIHLADSVDSIFQKQHELAMLSKNGAGVGIYLGDIRGRGAKISGNGVSEGIIPWAKCLDSTTSAVSQGSVRRGASAAYLPITHPDVEEFLQMRRPNGDPNRRCLNLHHAVCITDEFMHKLLNKDVTARHTWAEIMRTRHETGEPFLFFSDNVNKTNPDCYKAHNLKVSTSNICTEIMLHTDSDHTFVCCLSSLNLARWSEITDEDIYYSIWFLDAVLTEYIQKAKGIPGFEASVRSAEKGRAIGLGVLGWHTLLQSEMTPFDSLRAKLLNKAIFDRIRSNAERATKDLAIEYGEPEWCKGFNRRNSHLLAVAPTVSNSIISGSVSQGIEPIVSNAFAKKTAKGVFISQNSQLKAILQSLDKDTSEIWTSIATNNGSVQHLYFLSDVQKEVFKTAFEIDQLAIIELAANRQKYIDQGQSINLFFTADMNPKDFNNVHIEAWESGIKSLYYVRTTTQIKGDVASRGDKECAACEG